MKKLLFFFAMLMISTGAMAQSGVRGDANGDGEVGMPAERARGCVLCDINNS